MDYDLKVSGEDADLLVDALDSHKYWQLSPEERRDGGEVMEPLTDEERACETLADEIRQQTNAALRERIRFIEALVEAGGPPLVEITFANGAHHHGTVVEVQPDWWRLENAEGETGRRIFHRDLTNVELIEE